MKAWDERVAEARELSDQELTEAADCCTETTCLYHGPINTVRLERGIR